LPILPPEAVADAVAALRRGQVVAIPTDTVYGLVAMADDRQAVELLAELKGRAAEQPVQLLIDSFDTIARRLDDPSVLERVRAFWPGPLTAVVRVRPGFAAAAVTDAGTVGLRQPDDALALAVIAGCGGVLAATSANRHGEPPSLTASDVAAVFGDAMLVIDGGPRSGGVASTVIDLTVDPPAILRAGPVSAADLRLVG
jgi:L-threonylcarbamoyladenylate synthase